MLFWGVIIAIYIIFVFVYVYNETMCDVEVHEGGFLNMGYTTHSNRETTPRDVWKGVIWPLILVVCFVKTVIWLLNDLACTFLLLFGFYYKRTALYEWIHRVFG